MHAVLDRHERMHLTLKAEATKPASPNFLHQQERFDRFLRVYNHERPHQAVPGINRKPCPRNGPLSEWRRGSPSHAFNRRSLYVRLSSVNILINSTLSVSSARLTYHRISRKLAPIGV